MIYLLALVVSVTSISHSGVESKQPFQLIAHVEPSLLVNNFTVKGDTAYFVTLDGIEVFDLENQHSPKKIYRFDCGRAFRIEVEGDFAYIILGGTAGINVIDISQPGKCSVVGRYQTGDVFVDIEIRGQYMYLAVRDKGLEVIDISDPSNPVPIGHLYEPGTYSQEWMGYSCLEVDRNYAFIGQSEHEVKIIDVAEPTHPTKIAAIALNRHVADICVLDSLLVLSAMNELSFYDLSDIRKPTKLSSVTDFNMLGCITVDNNRMVVYDDRIVALDIGDPRCPEVIGGLDEYSHRLMFHNGYLYSAIKGIKVFRVLTSAEAKSGGVDFLGQVRPGTIPEQFAPDVIRLDGAIHGSIAFRPDGSEIYWTLHPSDYIEKPSQIMYVRKTDDGWTSPAVAPFCDENGAGEISISPAGDRLYFTSRRPLPEAWGPPPQPGSREWAVGKIWFVERLGDRWGEPQILEKDINHDLNGVSSTITGTLYSSGVRRIRKTVDGWGPVEWLGPPLDITKPGGQFKGGHPYIAPDESFIIFNADWPGHRGSGVFVSFRDSTDSWSRPINVLAEMGIERSGSVPVLSPDGKYLFYFMGEGFWWVSAKVIEELKPKE